VCGALKKYCDEFKAEKLVIGLPKDMSGDIGIAAEKVLLFIEKLKSVLSIEIIAWDERLSSKGASRYMESTKMSGKKKRQKIDQMASQVSEDLFVGFRLATGYSGQTYYETAGYDTDLGGDVGGADGWKKYQTYIDQLYMKYTPSQVDNLTVYLGKFQHNWKTKGMLIHPEGNGFQGIGVSYAYPITDTVTADLNLAGVIFAENVSVSTDKDQDSELYVADGGLVGALDNGNTWGARATLYYFDGMSETSGANITSSANNSNIGNVVTGVATVDYGFDIAEMPVALFAQYGSNFNNEAGVNAQDLYYAGGISINKLSEPGDWSLSYTYSHLELDVMPETLINADCCGTGKVQTLSLSYRLSNATDFSVCLIVPRTIDGDGETDTIQSKFNLTTKF